MNIRSVFKYANGIVLSAEVGLEGIVAIRKWTPAGNQAHYGVSIIDESGHVSDLFEPDVVNYEMDGD